MEFPWYYNSLFIITLAVFAIYTYGITLIIALVLLFLRNKQYPHVEAEFIEMYEDYETLEKKKNEEIAGLNDYTELLNEEINVVKKRIDLLKKEEQDIKLFLEENADEYLIKQTNADFSEDITSNEIKNALSMHKLKEKDLTKVIMNNQSMKKADANKKVKQLLRAFNAEADYFISNITLKNVDSYRNRITRSFEQLNKLFEIDKVKLNKDYLKLKLQELDIIYQYQVKIMEEKELLQAQKDEIREQQKVEKEIQNEKKRIEKESKQFNQEINRMIEYMRGAQNDVETKIYAEKIQELQKKLDVLEGDKRTVLEREQNTRAGFVYIISNIGSFGENIYKIGMTRRLEPMDRIKELSSASVPFPYDVHAIVFSADAPALETMLHQHFRENEINKVNHRKEFFNIDLAEVEKLVHNNFDKTIDFVYDPNAEQYRETMRINNKEDDQQDEFEDVSENVEELILT